MAHRKLVESLHDNFGLSSSLRIQPKPKATQHRRTTSDKNLLYVFLTAVFLVSVSLFAVQLPEDLGHHQATDGSPGVGVHQLTSTTRRRSVVVQYTDDKIPDPAEPSSEEQEQLHAEKEHHFLDDGSTATEIHSNNGKKRNRNASYHVVFSTGCSTFQVQIRSLRISLELNLEMFP